MNPVPNIDHIPARAKLLNQLRHFFDVRGLHEVQPPCLMRQCIVDAHIDPIQVSGNQLSLGASEDFYLQTSPELAMKRMLAAGSGSIYAIVPVFRAGESGPHHNVEFTMLEWYQVGADLAAGIATLGDLAREILGYERYEVDSYRSLFQRHLSIDPIEAPLTELAKLVDELDNHLAGSFASDRDGMLDVLMSHCIQPQLGLSEPTIVKNYPLSQAALATRCEDDHQCAARFELFYQGIELANGYDELCDPEILIQRIDQVNQTRSAMGKAAIEPPTLLIDAMRAGLPASAGVAMGVDRLMMVCSGENFRSSDLDKADKQRLEKKTISISDAMPLNINQV